MTFELPHFAAELLVVLPVVQILCARLKILALPPGRGLVGGGGAGGEGEGEGAAAGGAVAGEAAPAPAAPPPAAAAAARAAAAAAAHPDLAPSILTGTWAPDPSQRTLLGRVRANRRVLAAVVGVAALAAANALAVPLRLEASILAHPRTAAVTAAASAGDRAWRGGGLAPPLEAARAANAARGCPARAPAVPALSPSSPPPPPSPFRLATLKHAAEIAKMRAPEHADLIPLVEAALAVMRLSCEKFFVLATVLAAHLAFRDAVPRHARALIRLNHRLSSAFQRVILYSFPAVCWLHGAGFVFSAFVSVVFWGAPAQRAAEGVRKRATVVRPMGLRDATEGEVERANASCAVCWGAMGGPSLAAAAPMRLLGAGGPAIAARGGRVRSRGKALPCGHAFHGACIKRWLAQCHGQGRRPTCPLCNAVIELEVSYRFPLPWRPPGVGGVVAAPAALAAAPADLPAPSVAPAGHAAARTAAMAAFAALDAAAAGGGREEPPEAAVAAARSVHGAVLTYAGTAAAVAAAASSRLDGARADEAAAVGAPGRMREAAAAATAAASAALDAARLEASEAAARRDAAFEMLRQAIEAAAAAGAGGGAGGAAAVAAAPPHPRWRLWRR